MSSAQVDTHMRAALLEPQKNLKSKKVKRIYPALPPCFVCGGKSTGYHFGVISCEPCKIFFRRSLARETPYECKEKNNCEIGSGKWSSCSACRLSKCLELGMSTDSIVRGRHSHERKTERIDMVKQIEDDERKKQEEKETAEKQRKEEMEKLAAQLYEIHMKHNLVPPEKLEMIRRNEAQKKGIDKAVEDITGTIEPLPSEYIREFYQMTGIDLGGLRARLQVCLTQCHEALIKKCVEYSKEVPYFMDLSLADRILIVKASLLDWYLTSKYQVVNWKDKMYSCVNCGAVYTEEEQSVIPSVDFNEALYPNQMLQQLNLHPEEIAVLRAFVFFDTSQTEDELGDRKMIDSVQEIYLHCLLYVLEKHRGPKMASQTFAKISHVLTENRVITKWKVDFIEKILTTYKDIQLSQLVMEIFNIDFIENLQL